MYDGRWGGALGQQGVELLYLADIERVHTRRRLVVGTVNLIPGPFERVRDGRAQKPTRAGNDDSLHVSSRRYSRARSSTSTPRPGSLGTVIRPSTGRNGALSSSSRRALSPRSSSSHNGSGT